MISSDGKGKSPGTWVAYLDDGFDLADFPRGARVVDVGCGPGADLERLEARGCRAFGIEIDRTKRATWRERGLTVVIARAEELPLRDGAVEGILSNVVVQLTNESGTVAEMGRVLARTGRVRVRYHGAGYYLRYALRGPRDKQIYGLCTLIATILHRSVGRRPPGWLWHALFQSRGRLAGLYRPAGLHVVADYEGRRFLGLPVFFGQVLERR